MGKNFSCGALMDMRFCARMGLRLFVCLISFAGFFSPLAIAQGTSSVKTLSEASRVNETTVGVIYSREALYAKLVEDMERGLEPDNNLRIIPLVGKNQVQNIYDLLYLNGADLAIIRSDSVEYIHRFSEYMIN